MPSIYDNSLREALENEVVSTYKRVRRECHGRLTHRQLCKLVAQQPASRFYINTRRAREYCRKRDLGIMPPPGRSYHHSLLEAFYDIVTIEIQNATRYDNLKRVISRAICHPAPCLGINYRAVEKILHRKLHIYHKRPNHAQQ